MNKSIEHEIEIKIHRGDSVKELVDAFYRKNGSQGQARPDDLFFLAYKNSEIIGCVRFCEEEGTAMLRTMMIDETLRRQKIGHKLLLAFENYLNEKGVKNTLCIPYSHLEHFYGLAGFRAIAEKELPLFLQSRLVGYRSKALEAKNGKTFSCMRRP